jgi:hypothetical protein
MQNQKAAKPSTLFMSILDVHKKELFLKGYHEVMLGSFSQPGQFVKQLQQSFFEAYVQNVVEYNLAKFRVEITGFFKQTKNDTGNGKDKVTFAFEYSYDPRRMALTLYSLKATMNEDIVKEYSFESKKYTQLPAAENIHQQLFEMRDQQIKEAALRSRQSKSTKHKWKQ